MKNVEILDKEFNRLCWMDNNAENGLHFTQDKLSTSIDGGIYTLEFSSPKDSPQAVHLKEGHYITFLNRQGVRVLGTIMTVHDVGRYKKVYMEDTSLNLINKVVTKQELPTTAQPISFYLNNVLKETGWEIGDNESNISLQLEYTNSETLLARIRKIASDFGVEFYFETLIDTPGSPKFYIHIVKQRLEGDKGFRLSSDDFIEGIERKVNIDNVVTKLIVEGKETTSQSAGSTTTNKPTTVITKKYEQPVAKQFDASKATGATRLSTSGWGLSEVNQFKMNQADPPHVTGAYIDTFLRNFYPDSPLVGHGQKIKDYSDYFGVSVGAFLGVIAKESTYGRASCGGRYNFGCIMWTENSPFPKKWAGDRYWIDPPTIESALGAWFKLVRHNYIETGQVTYEAFLNKYSPTFENNHATFKNLMWAQLKSFGYNTSDNTAKKNYSSSSDNPLTLKVSNTSVSSNVSTVPSKSAHDKMVDKMIKWFTDREGKVTYSMNYRSGPSSYDCSSALYSALFYAGFKPNINYLGSTVSLWNDIGTNKLMYAINRSEARRGDIFLSGAKGSASAGASGHTGVFLSNNQIIHCNFRDNGITRTPVEGRAGSPLYVFRLVNKNPQVNIGGHISNMPTSSKVEGAVKRALSQVGGRYVYGGVAFKANDCSGLIYEAYRYAGFTINHRCTTQTIMAQKSPFKKISASEARRGDLAITMGGGHVEILLQEPSKGISVVHSATPELGIIKQNRHSGSLVGYYRVMDV